MSRAILALFSNNSCELATLLISFVARHLWDVPQIWITEDYWKLRYAQNLFQAFAFFTSRLPIFFLYLRLFGRNKIFRTAVYIGLGAAFAVYLTIIPLISYFCTPLPGRPWGLLDIFTKCKRIVVYTVIQGSFNIALDLYIFILPLQTIFGLHLPLKKRIGVFTIFGTGFLAVIASVVSLYYRYQLSYRPDINWNEGAYIAAASVELNIAIICGSMPACSSLAKHVFKESDVFVSFRSILDRYVPSLRSKSRSKKSKASYEVSYPSRIESNQRSMDSRAPLPGNGYMELQDVRSGIRTNEFTAGNPYYQAGRPLEHQQGITKTIQVEIV